MIRNSLSASFKYLITRGKFSTGKIPPPKSPTMEESFGPKFTEDELKIVMDPRGYLDA